MTRGTVLLLVCAALAAGCGPPTVRPVSFPDPELACPGGSLSWGLSIVDQRAQREGQAAMIASVRDAIQKSFPGCKWTGPELAGAAAISIEIHRFASVLDTGSWEAAVEWTVTARDSGGRTLTLFETNEEVSRPNYQGTNNEKESLSEAFRKALERTVKGLSAISNAGAFRPRQETLAPPGASEGPAGTAALTR